MYCPNCGCENSKHQNFCRFCGFYLTETAKSLKLQRAFGERAYKLKKSDQIKRISNRVSESLLIGFISGLIVVLLVDADKTKLFLKYSIALYVIFQIGLWFVNYRQREETKRNMGERNEADETKNRAFETMETSKLLEEKTCEPAAAAAVTENSTELLFVENKTRKFE